MDRGHTDTRVDSVGRTLAVVGDHWTFLVLREAFFRVRRFDRIQQNLGISRNILTGRLRHLVKHGILRRQRYQERPPRFEYRFTAKGLDLYGITVALMAWGDQWLAGAAGPPLRLIHKPCQQIASPHLVCGHCGRKILARDMDFMPGPGAIPAARSRRRSAQRAGRKTR